MPQPRSWGATGPTRPSASSTPAWRPGASTAREQRQPRGGGAAGGEDGRALAERGAAGPLPGAGRSGARRRLPAQQRFPLPGRRRSRLQVPRGAHIRRVPRDADIIGVTRLHRIIRRGTTWAAAAGGCPRGRRGRPRPGRGFPGAHLDRQFEFIKTDWVNDGNFIGYSGEKDPVAGHRGERTSSPSRSSPSGAACRTCRPSSSPAAVSTASYRGCAPCAGWRTWTPDRRRVADDATTLSPAGVAEPGIAGP